MELAFPVKLSDRDMGVSSCIIESGVIISRVVKLLVGEREKEVIRSSNTV